MATQAAEQRIYRSHNAYVGGVCAGLAERFDLDAIVVRILAILISTLTLGIGAVAYVVLWVRLPLEPDSSIPYDVQPESAESNALGCMDYQASLADSAEKHREGGVSMMARFAVAICLTLLFLAVSTGVAPLMPGTKWWQFWPIALIITGLSLIIIPIPTRFEGAWHALGIAITSLAASLLPMSLNVMSWHTLSDAFTHAWFLVAAAAVLCIIGLHRGNNTLVIGASFLIVMFFLFALTICAMPGEVETLMLHMPDGRLVRISFVNS